MSKHGPRVCMYCLAKYHIRLLKDSDGICDIEWRDKYGPPLDENGMPTPGGAS